MRAAALVALFALCGCAWLVKHPPAAAAVTGITVGFAACEIDNGPIATCGATAGIVGAALGGIALLVTLFADTGQHATAAPEPTPGPRIRVLAPPPIDAGVPPLDAPPLDAAPLTTDAAPPPADGG